MLQKLFLGSLWLGLIVYGVFFFAGDSQATDLDLIIALSKGSLAGINPLIVSIFYIMGIFPIVYGAFILFDCNQKISPLPFFMGSFGFGAFALLPYLVLRQPNQDWNRAKGKFLAVLDSRWLAITASGSIVGLLLWGLLQGDWQDFVGQWQTSKFIHVMTLDFCCLSLLLPTVIADDAAQRDMTDTKWIWLPLLLPLFGGLIYWCCRTPLPGKLAEASA